MTANKAGLDLNLENLDGFLAGFEKIQKKADAADQSIERLRASITHLDQGLNSTKGIRNFTRNLSSSVREIKEAVTILSVDPAAQGNVKSLNAFLSSLGESLNKFFASVKNVDTAEGFSTIGLRRFALSIKDISTLDITQADITKVSEFFTSLDDFDFKKFGRPIRELSKELASFNVVANPKALADIVGFVKELPALFEVLGKVQGLQSKFNLVSNRGLTGFLMGLRPFMRILGEALSGLSGVAINQADFSAAAGFLKDLPNILQVLSGVQEQVQEQSSKFRNLLAPTTRMKSFLVGIRPFMNILSEALSSLNAIDSDVLDNLHLVPNFLKKSFEVMGEFRSQEFTVGALGLNKMAKLFPVLRRVDPAIREFSKVMKVMAQGLRNFNKVPSGADLFGISKAIRNMVLVMGELQNIDTIGTFQGALKRFAPIFTSLRQYQTAFKILGQGIKIISGSLKEGINARGVEHLGTAIKKIVNALETLTKLASVDLKRVARNLRQTLPLLINALEDVDLSKIPTEILRGLAMQTAKMNQAGADAAQIYADGFKEGLGIASPSRVFMRIGGFILKGLEKGTSPVTRLGQKFSDNFRDGFKTLDPRNLGRSFVQKLADTIRGSAGLVRQAAESVASTVQETGNNLMQRSGNLFSFGKNALLTGGLIGFVQGGMVNMTADFDQVLNQIQVFGQLTTEELSTVQDEILEFSALTIFDPSQSAEAFLGLQKAGLGVAESLAAIEPIGNLAAAAQLELGNATEFAIQTMSAFRLPIEDINRVIDTFVGAADISTGEVTDFAEALKFIGPVASNLNIPIEEMGAALAFLNDQGIKSGQAGRGLRAALSSLAAPTSAASATLNELGVNVADAQGNFVGMESLVQQFAGAISQLRAGGAGDVEIFEMLSALGDRNTISTLLALVNTTESGALGFEEYAKSLENANSAQTVATSMMDTFKGSLTSLKGSVDTLIIKALQPLLNDVLKPMIGRLIPIVNSIGELDPRILKVAAGGALLVAGLTTLAGVLALVAAILTGALGGGLVVIGGLIGGITTVLLSPIGLVVGLTAAAGAFGFFGDIVDGVKGIVESVVGTIQNLVTEVTAVVDFYKEARDFVSHDAAAERQARQARRQELLDEIEDINREMNTALAAGGSGSSTHTAVAGDNLWSIAAKRAEELGLTTQEVLDQIYELNDGINADNANVLRIGTEIILPGGEPAADVSELQDELDSTFDELAAVDLSLEMDRDQLLSEQERLESAIEQMKLDGIEGEELELFEARLRQVNQALEIEGTQVEDLEAKFKRFASTGVFDAIFGGKQIGAIGAAFAVVRQVDEALAGFKDTADQARDAIREVTSAVFGFVAPKVVAFLSALWVAGKQVVTQALEPMQGAFERLKRTNIESLLVGIGVVLGVIFGPVIISAVAAFATGVYVVVAAFNILARIAEPVIQTLEGLGDIVMGIVDIFQGEGADRLFEGLTNFYSGIGGIGKGVVTGLAATIGQIGDFFFDLLGFEDLNLGERFEELAGTAMDGYLGVLGGLGSAVLGLISGDLSLAEAGTQIWEVLSGAGSDIGGLIWDALSAGLGFLSDHSDEIKTFFVDALSAGLDLLVGGVELVASLGSKLWDFAKQGFDLLIDNAPEIASTLANLISGGASLLASTAVSIGSSIWDFVKSGFETLKDNAPDVMAEIVTLIEDGAALLVGAVNSIGTYIWDFIWDGIAAITGIENVERVKTQVLNLITGGVMLLVTAATLIPRMLIQFVVGLFDGLSDAENIGDIKDAFVDAIEGALDLLPDLDFGEIFSGIGDAIEGAIGGVDVSFLTDVFTGAVDTVEYLFTRAKLTILRVLDAITGAIEGAVNYIISQVNKLPRVDIDEVELDGGFEAQIAQLEVELGFGATDVQFTGIEEGNENIAEQMSAALQEGIDTDTALSGLNIGREDIDLGFALVEQLQAQIADETLDPETRALAEDYMNRVLAEMAESSINAGRDAKDAFSERLMEAGFGDIFGTDSNNELLSAILLEGFADNLNFDALQDDLASDENLRHGLHDAIREGFVMALMAGDFDTIQNTIDLADSIGFDADFQGTAMEALLSGIQTEDGALVGSALTFLGDMELSDEDRSQLNTLGFDIVDGMLVGLNDNTTLAADEFNAFSDTIQSTLQASWQVESPSVWMQDLGMNLMLGLEQGLKLYNPLVDAQFLSLTTSMKLVEKHSKIASNSVGDGWATAANRMLSTVPIFLQAFGALIAGAKDLAFTLGTVQFPLAPTASTPTSPPGRASGGPVRRGQPYETNEGGIAEIFQTRSGRTFFLPGQDGRIDPVNQPAAGGSSVTNITEGDMHIALANPVNASAEELMTLFKAAYRDERQRDAASNKLVLSGR